MPSDKSKKSKNSGDDLDEMRDAYRRHKQKKGGAGGGGGAKDWDKIQEGKNMRRVLRRYVDGKRDRKFYTEGWTHFNVGPNERAVRCIDEGKINDDKGLPESGTSCPLCKKFLREQSRINSEYKKGDEEGQAEWKRAKDKYAARKQYYSNVLVEDDDGDFVVRILAYGTQIWAQLMNYYLGDDTSIGDFTDFADGRWINIKKINKGGRDRRNVGYEVYPASESSDISDAEEAIVEQLHDLDAAAGQVLSKDEVVAIMKGIDTDKEDKDEKSDEDEDGDDEDEDGGGEEEEDEDERPVKVKNSKLASKMKNRRDRD